MTDEYDDWWKNLLAEHTADGRRAADSGSYDPPWPGSDDPQDEAENAAYRRGFDQRRRELGAAFKWT